MSNDDPQRYGQRDQVRAAAAQQLADGMLAEARRLAARLKQEAGVTRVWLFGSLAWGNPEIHRDIDLAVEGLPAARHVALYAEILMTSAAPVDLIRLEDAPAALQSRIRLDGVRL